MMMAVAGTGICATRALPRFRLSNPSVFTKGKPDVTTTLLSSAPTLQDALASVTDFYCGTKVRLVAVDPAAPSAWRIVRESDGKTLEGVSVRRQRDRYRFEMH